MTMLLVVKENKRVGELTRRATRTVEVQIDEKRRLIDDATEQQRS